MKGNWLYFNKKMDRWIGKTAIVTGASAGIGAVMCVQLANFGLHVIGLARRAHLVDVSLFTHIISMAILEKDKYVTLISRRPLTLKT